MSEETMVEEAPQCWICKSTEGLTGEHQVNRADLRDFFGDVSQADPLYLHTDKRRNLPVGSLRAKVLKSSRTMCATCNGARTQPHDRAFTGFRRALEPILSTATAGQSVRFNRLFPYDTRKQMLSVHLYFVKKFGEYIVEGGAGIDIEPFAQAILTGTPHPEVYLRFGFGPTYPDGERHVGRTPMEIAHAPGNPRDVGFAIWFAGYNGLSVSVMYAKPGQRRKGLEDSWRPRTGDKCMIIADFRGTEVPQWENQPASPDAV